MSARAWTSPPGRGDSGRERNGPGDAMKRFFLGLPVLLSACAEGGGTGPAAISGGVSIPPGPVEYLVLNGRMTFEECRQRGGLIIDDPAGAMVACDPTVQRPRVLEQENT